MEGHSPAPGCAVIRGWPYACPQTFESRMGVCVHPVPGPLGAGIRAVWAQHSGTEALVSSQGHGDGVAVPSGSQRSGACQCVVTSHADPESQLCHYDSLSGCPQRSWKAEEVPCLCCQRWAPVRRPWPGLSCQQRRHYWVPLDVYQSPFPQSPCQLRGPPHATVVE